MEDRQIVMGFHHMLLRNRQMVLKYVSDNKDAFLRNKHSIHYVIAVRDMEMLHLLAAIGVYPNFEYAIDHAIASSHGANKQVDEMYKILIDYGAQVLDRHPPRLRAYHAARREARRQFSASLAAYFQALCHCKVPKDLARFVVARVSSRNKFAWKVYLLEPFK